MAGRKEALQPAKLSLKLYFFFKHEYFKYPSNTGTEGELEEYMQNHNLDSLKVAISELSGRNV